MTVRRVVTGSVLAAGLGVAGLMGAGDAFAGPGISIAGGDNQVGLGDQNQGSGAYAEAGKNNLSLAISTGLNPKGATAISEGNDNTAVSIDGVTLVGPGSHRPRLLGIRRDGGRRRQQQRRNGRRIEPHRR